MPPRADESHRPVRRRHQALLLVITASLILYGQNPVAAYPPVRAERPHDERSLATAVRRVNDEVAKKFGKHDPRSLTVDRVRDAIVHTLEIIRQTDDFEFPFVVEPMKEILATGQLPPGVKFSLVLTKGTYGPDSPYAGKTVITLNYTLFILNPYRDAHQRVVGLPDLHETVYEDARGNPIDRFLPVAAEKGETGRAIEFETFLAFDQDLQTIEKYRDNVFLYEEKLRELYDEVSEKVTGREIEIPFKVWQVTREDVIGVLPPKWEEMEEEDVERDDLFFSQQSALFHGKLPTLIFLMPGAEKILDEELMETINDVDGQLADSRVDWTQLPNIPHIGGNFLAVNRTADSLDGQVKLGRSVRLSLQIGSGVDLETAKQLRRGDELRIHATVRRVLVSDHRGNVKGFVFLLTDPNVEPR